MYLSECPPYTKFQITEFWLFYHDREVYQELGFYEGEEIFVVEHSKDYILVCKSFAINNEIISLNIEITYEDAAQIYGEVINDKQNNTAKSYHKHFKPYYFA